MLSRTSGPVHDLKISLTKGTSRFLAQGGGGGGILKSRRGIQIFYK